MAGFKNKTKYTKHNQDVGVYLAREGRALSSRFWPYNLQSNIDVNDQKRQTQAHFSRKCAHMKNNF